MTLYSEIEKLSDTLLAAITAKAGAGMRSGTANAPYVLRREVDGTFSCVFGPYLDEDFHRQSVGQRDGARAFSIAALKKIFWDYMLDHEVAFDFNSSGQILRGKAVCIYPAKLKEEPCLRIDVGTVEYRVASHEVRTTLEEMIGIKENKHA